MGENLRIDSVFQRSDNIPAVRVVFRVRGKNNHNVEGNPDIESPDLNVFFFQDVEQPYLNTRL